MNEINSSMIKRGLIFLVMLAVTSQAVALMSVDDQLAGLLNSYHTYQARFSQTTKDDRQHVVQTGSGLFYLQRPDKFSWQQQRPNSQIIVSDGTFTWVYDVDLMQVTKRPLSHAALNPAQLLAGDFKQVARQFTIKRIFSRADNVVFQLTPKNQQNNFKEVSLHFLHKKLVSLQLINNLGQTSNFSFSQVKINGVIPAKTFQFMPPKGVQVLTS